MENPSAIELSATAALQKNSLLNGQTPKTAAAPGDEGGLAVLPRLEADAAGTKDKSVGKAQFTKNIQKAFDNIQQLGRTP